MSTMADRFHLATSMVKYGVGLGALAGFLVSMMILLTRSNLALSFFVFGAIWGAFIGMSFGGFSGAISGMMMAVATEIFFPKIHSQRIFRYTMGIITFSMSGWVFMMGNFDSYEVINRPTWFLVGLLSVLIAVAASQRATKIYLREIDPRKMKESMTF